MCKQTEIVIAPIRLNRKPSQLDVYSEPGCRGQGLLREHFLDSEQTDVRRQVTVEANKSDAPNGTLHRRLQGFTSGEDDEQWQLYARASKSPPQLRSVFTSPLQVTEQIEPIRSQGE